MSTTVPLSVRAGLRPQPPFVPAWALQPPMPTHRRGARALLEVLRRRMRDALDSWRQRRQIRATRLALMNLDAATLRDIGIVRTEIDSQAVEAHGAVAATRARLLSRAGPMAH